MLIDGEKYACEACIRGHRVSNCEHRDRPLTKIAKKGRPVSQCAHCRGLRKSRSAHAACECGIKSHTKSQCANGSRVAEHSGCCCTHGQRCTCALKKEPMDSVIESPYDGAIGPFNATHQAETSIQPMINSLNSLNSPGYPHMPHQQPRNPSSFPVANPINGFYPPRAPRRPSSRPRSRDHTPLRTGQGRSRALSDGKAPSREARWSGSSAHSPMTRSPSHASITKRHLAPLDLNFYPTPSSFTSGAPNVPRSTRHSVDPISASTMSSDNFNFLSSPDNDSAVNSAVDIQSNWSFPDVLSSASSVSNVGSVAGSGVFGYQKPWHTPQYVHSGLPAAWDEPALSQHPNQLQDSSMMFAHRVMPSRPASHNSWTFDSARSSLSYAQPAYPTIHSDLELSRIHRGSSYSLPTYGEEYPQSMPSLVPCKSETLVPQESAMLMADDPFDLPIQMPMDDMWTPANGHVNGHAGIMSQH